jgi:hypothetical protein
MNVLVLTTKVLTLTVMVVLLVLVSLRFDTNALIQLFPQLPVVPQLPLTPTNPDADVSTIVDNPFVTPVDNTPVVPERFFMSGYIFQLPPIGSEIAGFFIIDDAGQLLSHDGDRNALVLSSDSGNCPDNSCPAQPTNSTTTPYYREFENNELIGTIIPVANTLNTYDIEWAWGAITRLIIGFNGRLLQLSWNMVVLENPNTTEEQHATRVIN